MALTKKFVEKALPPGRYGDGNNLFLQVGPTGTKSWLFRYQRGLNSAGKPQERWAGLGAAHTFDLEEARERARRMRQQLADGIDPLDARKAERAAKALEAARTLTFEEAGRQYHAAHERGWSRKHSAQFLATLEANVFPKIGKLPVASIDTGLILKCLEAIWTDKPETANRVRGRIESILDWATVRGYRTGDNPARWGGHLSEVLPSPASIAKPKHYAALPYAELPEFMEKLATVESIAARALEFTILTAARTGETIGARWDEIDLQSATWTVPGERMKAGKQHKVPLSERAVAILEAIPREAGGFVFVGASAGAHLGKLSMYRVMKRLRDDIDVHGFRSSFSDWAHEVSAFPNHVIEMSLAHSVGSAVERSYRRGDLFDKRHQLMATWAKFCTSKPVTAAEVVPISRGRR
jgi:integrase